MLFLDMKETFGSRDHKLNRSKTKHMDYKLNKNISGKCYGESSRSSHPKKRSV